MKKKKMEINVRSGYDKCPSCEGLGFHEFNGDHRTCRKCWGIGEIRVKKITKVR